MSTGETPVDTPAAGGRHAGQHPADLLPAYVLDVLDAEDARAIASHVAQCATCAADVQRLQEVVDLLRLVAPPQEPPPASRTNLLDRVRRDRLTGADGSSLPER